MNNKKVFVISFAITLAVLLPIYFVFASLAARSATKPAENIVTDVPMARPMSQDAKNLLLITQSDKTYAFVLLRFDALDSKICSVALAPETVLLCDGKPVRLIDAMNTAGPELARLALEETLEIRVNNYLVTSATLLAEMAAPLGSGSMPLTSYMSDEALGQLKLLVPGVENIELSPLRLCEVLASGLVPLNMLPTIRADGYLAFLRSGILSLPEIIPAALRKHSRHLDTSIQATDIYDYERILQFLAKQEPSFKTVILSGNYIENRYELESEALAQAKIYLC